ncbi:MAG: VWA domain-containing protein [Succinivibrio sp.]|nr:VWA domain-containing protein [Succinivibrio sp.]
MMLPARFMSCALSLILLLAPLSAQSTECLSKCKDPKSQHLDLVLIIDKSGSMHGLEDDTIGGFNAMLDKQKALDIPTEVTTVMFNHQQQTLHEREALSKVQKLTARDYQTGGSTALLDSIGRTLETVSCYPKLGEQEHKVIVAIITDGKENASSQFSKQQVKKLIESKQEEGWEFVFLGANIDAVGEAGQLGIDAQHAVKYKNSAKGVRANYEAVAAFAAESLSEKSAPAEKSWRDTVVEDK